VTVWVAESDWSTVKVGQTVHLTNADGEVTFEVRFLAEGGLKGGKAWYWGEAWSLFVEAPATPPLPTEPGWYIDRDDGVWCLHEGSLWLYNNYTNSDPKRFAPFTRLEPAPETAQKVLEDVRALSEAASTYEIGGLPVYEISEHQIRTIAADFGVTS
jgi:hypothetical protein